jgi:transcriptional regulator with XRE-family HTH domain
VRKKLYLRKQKEIIAFGRHLRNLREGKQMTMVTLAALSDVEYSQISRIERGLISTSLSQVFAIADALEIPYKELFDFTKE